MTETQGDRRADSAPTAHRGVLLGVMAAVGYSATNLALKGLSERQSGAGWDLWVSAMKAVPTVLIAGVLLILRHRRKQPLFPTRKPIPGLILAALVMQFGGNLGFQIALGHIGLAITVPLVFALIICAGAILGRMFLGDGVTPRTLVAMAVMTVSIVLLSWAAMQAQSASTPESGPGAIATNVDLSSGQSPVNRGNVWLGIMAAGVSGLSYGINGVVIRRIARDSLPIESMLIIYSSTGLICLTIPGVSQLGWERIQQIQAVDMASDAVCRNLQCSGVLLCDSCSEGDEHQPSERDQRFSECHVCRRSRCDFQ
ncbi:MAG: DMT family transporter [Planctomycetaceae bacterium]